MAKESVLNLREKVPSFSQNELRPRIPRSQNENFSPKTSLKQVYEENQLDVSDTQIEQLLIDPPATPHFPIIMFMAAVAKDALDWPSNISGFMFVLVWVTSFMIGVALFIWMLGKMGLGRKQLLRWFFGFVIEFIPGLSMAPMFTIFVLFAHYKDTKVVQLFFATLEKARGK